jgi:hypothetical protein
MIGTLLKMEAYKHAPRATFAALNPKKSAQVAHMKYDLKHAYAPRLTAVGAALLAFRCSWLQRHSRSGKPVARPHTAGGVAGNVGCLPAPV